MAAGSTTPPTAASMGKSAWRGWRSSPTVISYFSSMPTSRKKIAMRKSFTKSSKVSENSQPPMAMVTGWANHSWSG